MSDFFGKLKSGAGKVAFEADKMARLNRVQGEQGQIKRQIEAQYMKLGEMVYRQHINQTIQDPAIPDICQYILELEQQMAAKVEEVQRINAETYSPQGAPAPAPVQPAPAPVSQTPVQPSAPLETFAVQQGESVQPIAAEQPAPQTKFCANCGKEMPVTVKFCPDCGTKV